MGKSKKGKGPGRPSKADRGSGWSAGALGAAAAAALAALAAAALLLREGGGGVLVGGADGVPVRAFDNGAVLAEGEDEAGEGGAYAPPAEHNLTAADLAEESAHSWFSAADGRRIRALGGVSAGMEVLRVPRQPGKHFVWPGYAIGHRFAVPDVQSPVAERPIELEMYSRSPKVFHVHNFLSAEEVRFLVKKAQSKDNPYSIRPSTTGHKSWTQGGEAEVASTRTSHNGFDVDSPTAMAVKRRAFELLRIDYVESLADGIQILRYKPKQAYIGHHDYFPTGQSGDFNWDPQRGGSNRFATVLLYLSDVSEGGGTVFNRKVNATALALHGGKSLQELVADSDAAAAFKKRKQPWEEDLVKACHTHFSLRPKSGDAILFYSQNPDGSLDDMSEHAGCPVLNGTKWAANVWVWNAPRYGQ